MAGVDMILVNGHTVTWSISLMFDWHQIWRAFIFHMDRLDFRTHVQIPSRTPTFRVKALGLTRPFNKPIFDTLVYSLPLSYLCLVFSSMHTLYGVLDDAPSYSVASWHSLGPHVAGWAPLEGRRFTCCNVMVTTYSFHSKVWHHTHHVSMIVSRLWNVVMPNIYS